MIYITYVYLFRYEYVHVQFVAGNCGIENYCVNALSLDSLFLPNHTARTYIEFRMEDEISSFWGPVTSSTDWCEQNYVYSSYIAEFFNTIGNIPGILLALIGLVNALRQRFEKRFSILHLSNIILAMGGMLFHATLQRL